MRVPRKKNTRDELPTLADYKNLEASLKHFEQRYFKEAEENRELKKTFDAKARHMLFAFAVYSFVVTILAGIKNPMFMQDVMDFLKWLKDAVISLFWMGVAGGDFVAEIFEKIPLEPVAFLLEIVGYLVCVVGVFATLIALTVLLVIWIQYSCTDVRDYVTGIVMLSELAILIFFGDWIKSLISINLVAVYLIATVIFVLLRKEKQFRDKGLHHWNDKIKTGFE